MTPALAFDCDDACRCISVVIGVCELAAAAVDGAKGETVEAFDPEMFDACACLLMKAREVVRGEMMGARIPAGKKGGR